MRTKSYALPTSPKDDDSKPLLSLVPDVLEIDKHLFRLAPTPLANAYCSSSQTKLHIIVCEVCATLMFLRALYCTVVWYDTVQELLFTVKLWKQVILDLINAIKK